MNRILLGNSFDPWRNLAVEELIFASAGDDVTLYLWQNANTVVIGRNQNAWRECRHELLEAEGGRLARRTSGGGAVFHDLGNLNFTFVAPKERYDLSRQLGVILRAVRSLGVEAGFSGRNDLITENGAKFSGNAFRHGKNASLHHGTLLIDADMAKLGRYLSPPKQKLIAKGVESVRSRVCNLSEFGESINVQSLKQAVMAAFIEEYGRAETAPAEPDEAQLLPIYQKHASWEWRMGASPAFELSRETRFEWGMVELHISCENGLIKDAAVYSDAMDEKLIRGLAPALFGARASGGAIADRLRALMCERGASGELEDMAEWAAGLEL